MYIACCLFAMHTVFSYWAYNSCNSICWKMCPISWISLCAQVIAQSPSLKKNNWKFCFIVIYFLFMRCFIICWVLLNSLRNDVQTKTIMKTTAMALIMKISSAWIHSYLKWEAYVILASGGKMATQCRHYCRRFFHGPWAIWLKALFNTTKTFTGFESRLATENPCVLTSKSQSFSNDMNHKSSNHTNKNNKSFNVNKMLMMIYSYIIYDTISQ